MPQENAEDSVSYARDEVSFGSLGSILADLAEQLQSVADRAQAEGLKREIANMEEHGLMDEGYERDIDLRIEATRTRVLSGLKQFRRNYDYWERAIAEQMLASGMSQRDVARYLGVATSTINRWAQHPLESDVR